MVVGCWSVWVQEGVLFYVSLSACNIVVLIGQFVNYSYERECMMLRSWTLRVLSLRIQLFSGVAEKSFGLCPLKLGF